MRTRLVRPKQALALLFVCLFSAAFALGTINFQVKAADANCQLFSETGFSVCGKFLNYWKSHGGLEQQGFPISGEFNEQNAAPPSGDGQNHRVQYFQRARFEEHLENAAPNDILLGLLGTEEYTSKYNISVLGNQRPQDGCQYFPETGYNVCGAFLAYWQRHGGLAQQGFPISEFKLEQNLPPPAGDGKIHNVQYFQRARFEEHTEISAVNNTLLGLLGSEQYQAKYAGKPSITIAPTVPPTAPAPTVTPVPTSKPVPQPTPVPTQAPVQTSGVTFVSVQGNSPGRNASVTVQTSAGAQCDIDYYTPKGTHSTAAGLVPKTANGSGIVSWTWLIGGNTTRGTGEVDVTCNGVTASTDITIG